jgi:hypothetical protein
LVTVMPQMLNAPIEQIMQIDSIKRSECSLS